MTVEVHRKSFFAMVLSHKSARRVVSSGAIAWIVFLTLASLAFSYVFACAAPFAALATLAALNVRERDAYVLAALVWFANQAVGYGLLNYPRTFDSYAWGVAIGVAALLAARTVVVVERSALHLGPVLGTVICFLSAFAMYEFLLYIVSWVLPGSDDAFSLRIVWYVLKVNALGLSGLFLLSLAADAAGLTRPVTTPAGRG